MSTTHGQEPDPDKPVYDTPGHQTWAQPQGPAPPAGTGPYRQQPPQQPPAWPFPPPPYGSYPEPQPRKRRTWLIIGLSVAVAAVLAVVSSIVVLNNGGTNSSSASHTPIVHTITLPASVAGYTRMTGNVAERLAAAARAGMMKESHGWASAYAAAKIGFYTKVGVSPYRLVFIGFSAADSAKVASALRSQTASDRLDSVFLGAGVANTQDFPAGPLGGTLRCGRATRNAVPFTVCAWTDSSVLGSLWQNGISPTRLAEVALAFREVAEH